MNKKLTVVILVLFGVFLLTAPLQAWTPRLERADYLITGSTSDIEALQLKLNVSFDAINETEGLFYYDGENFDLKGTWLLNFLQQENLTSQVRLSAATDFNQRELAPALGVGGEIDLGQRNFLLYSLDYYLTVDDNNWVYQAGLGIPLVANSGFTITAGNSYWNRDNINFSLGIRVEF